MRESISDSTVSKRPHSVTVNRNSVASVLLSEYSSKRVHEILGTSLSVVFEDEKATDLSGLTREAFSIFFTDIQERFFEGNVACVPRVDPQTCRTLSSTDDTMFTTIGKIISHCYILTEMFPVFISNASMQSVLVKGPIKDELLISSFFGYVETFEKEAIQSIMNVGDAEPDEDNLDTALNVFSRCQANSLPTKDNIHQMVVNAARSELICRPTHALQAICNGMITAHPSLWACITEGNLTKLYDGLIPTPRRVWKQLLLPCETPSRQEEKILDYLRRFIFSLEPKLLGLFLRFSSGNQYIGKKINIVFNAQEPGFQRSPSANTCSPHLHLPTSYSSYTEFKTEFSSVLNHSDEWFMDLQ